eukprot:6205119-Pleurochrysis_carterae.AAC.2
MHDATTHADERAARRDLAFAEMRQIDPSDVWDDEFLQVCGVARSFPLQGRNGPSTVSDNCHKTIDESVPPRLTKLFHHD